MENSTASDSFAQDVSGTTSRDAKVVATPSSAKAKLLLWDALGFSLVAIFLTATFYWIPQITFATYIFIGITTFSLFAASIVFSWKSSDIEETKLAYWSIMLNSLFVIYVLFSVMLGVIASSTLSGIDFSIVNP